MAVFVVGGYQTDFARNVGREGGRLDDLVREAVEGALAEARLGPEEIGVVHVGNAFGELFAGQAQLGAMPATVVPGLWGKPSSRHEAACASGSVALLAACADLEAGRYDCALVVGVEQERNVPGELAARHMGTAALAGREGQEARFLWPHMFSVLTQRYEEERGPLRPLLAAIARKNLANARQNPRAQTRSWCIEDSALDAEDERNPRVEGRVHRLDCSQVTDGAAALVLCNEAGARAFAGRSGEPLERIARIVGWGHRSAGLSLDAKWSRGDTHLFPHLRDTLGDALRRAGLASAAQLGGLEVHDCFSITEYMIADHLGLAPPGGVHRLIEGGHFERSGPLPINPSGGLIGGGHPVGATGVRMALDAARQVTGKAGACQIEGARTFGTLNLGGSATTVVSLLLATG
jgi:acetyl-CoA C-acetyltransferase